MKQETNIVLDNSEKIYMNNIVRDTVGCFEINKIDIDKIRVSEKYPYRKNGKYRNLIFYETEDNYVPLKIVLRDIEGYYGEYKGINSMNFMIVNEVYDRFYNIFQDIEQKSGTEEIIYSFESSYGNDYLKKIYEFITIIKMLSILS